MSKNQMRVYIIIIAAILISSCSGTKNLTELSELTIDNRPVNKLIVDRNPDYGIDGRDGCVVMGEISMDIAELENGKSIRGKVFDSGTRNPLTNAKLTLFIDEEGSTKKIEIEANENGIYQSELNGKLNKIEVDYIAYRTLKIDIRKL
tara:strand:- start:176 stop:619 length:444 start_codon:yes stop_codon:yes gene_type:complete